MKQQFCLIGDSSHLAVPGCRLLSCGAPTSRTGPVCLPTQCWATLNPKKVWSPAPTFTMGARVSRLNPAAGPGPRARAAKRRLADPTIISLLSHSVTVTHCVVSLIVWRLCAAWCGQCGRRRSTECGHHKRSSRSQLLSPVSPASAPVSTQKQKTGKPRNWNWKHCYILKRHIYLPSPASSQLWRILLRTNLFLKNLVILIPKESVWAQPGLFKNYGTPFNN